MEIEHKSDITTRVMGMGDRQVKSADYLSNDRYHHQGDGGIRGSELPDMCLICLVVGLNNGQRSEHFVRTLCQNTLSEHFV